MIMIKVFLGDDLIFWKYEVCVVGVCKLWVRGEVCGGLGIGFWKLLFGLLLFVMLISGCGGGEDDVEMSVVEC